MNKLYLILFIVAVHTGILWSQSVSQSVVSTSGDFLTTGSAQLSFTLGEPVSETIRNSSCVLSQGFQQVFISVSPGPGPDNVNNFQFAVELSVFPNPTDYMLNIKIEDGFEEGMSAVLFSLDGKAIREINLEADQNSIDMQDLPAGVYLLKIINHNQFEQSFKVYKHKLNR